MCNVGPSDEKSVDKVKCNEFPPFLNLPSPPLFYFASYSPKFIFFPNFIQNYGMLNFELPIIRKIEENLDKLPKKKLKNIGKNSELQKERTGTIQKQYQPLSNVTKI